MTTFGYILPDPNIPNRFSVWFTGGVLEEVPNKSQKRSFPSQKWKDTFQSILSRPSFTDIAKQISARFMLGIKVPSYMDEVDGSMQFQFIDRPVGGHGNAYVDVRTDFSFYTYVIYYDILFYLLTHLYCFAYFIYYYTRFYI